MPFTLADGDRMEFQQAFRPGHLWPDLRGDHEALRFWCVLRETPDEAWIVHGTGAAARLSIRDGRLASVTLLEGSDAEAFLRKHGFPVDGALRTWARKVLRKGRLLAEALESEGRQDLTPLGNRTGPDGGERRFYRFPWKGVLELNLREGRILSHRWHQGGDALDLLRAFRQENPSRNAPAQQGGERR